ncbi:MAG TPA: malonic semialdehyde reductase [Kofleriaceae bacterium]|jgi:3-hydroxypropanoate dehydrogenase
MLDHTQLFTDARTHYGWLPEPVDDATLQKIYELARWPPTGNNGQTMRIVFVRSAEAKERLRPALFPMNVEKAMTAPVTALIAYDATWWTHMPYLTGKQSDQYLAMTEERRDYLGHFNAVLGAAYMIIAARSLGLDCGPMGGFDRGVADAAFFPDGAWRSILLLSVGHGDPEKLRPRMPRLAFETACRIA